MYFIFNSFFFFFLSNMKVYLLKLIYTELFSNVLQLRLENFSTQWKWATFFYLNYIASVILMYCRALQAVFLFGTSSSKLSQWIPDKGTELSVICILTQLNCRGSQEPYRLRIWGVSTQWNRERNWEKHCCHWHTKCLPWTNGNK